MRDFLVPGILVKEIVRKKYYKERVFHVKIEIPKGWVEKNSRNSIFTAEEEVAKSINDFFFPKYPNYIDITLNVL